MPSCGVQYDTRMLRAIIVAWVMAEPASAAQPVEGRVVNAATGTGIQKATVRIFPADDGPANGFSVTTDSQGRFRIESMEVGAYGVMYEAAGFRGVPERGGSPPLFQVGNGAEPVRLEVKMQQLGKLSGRVLDAAGEPVPSADVGSLLRTGDASRHRVSAVILKLKPTKKGYSPSKIWNPADGCFPQRRHRSCSHRNRTPINNSDGRRPSFPGWSIHRMPRL